LAEKNVVRGNYSLNWPEVMMMAVIYMDDEWKLSEEQKHVATVLVESALCDAEMKVDELQEELNANALFEKLDLIGVFRKFASGLRNKDDMSLDEEVLKQVYYQKIMS